MEYKISRKYLVSNVYLSILWCGVRGSFLIRFIIYKKKIPSIYNKSVTNIFYRIETFELTFEKKNLLSKEGKIRS